MPYPFLNVMKNITEATPEDWEDFGTHQKSLVHGSITTLKVKVRMLNIQYEELVRRSLKSGHE